MLRPAAPLVGFAVNEAFIVENLCVERFSEENLCGGRCFLKDRLAQQENETGSEAQSLIVAEDAPVAILLALPPLEVPLAEACPNEQAQLSLSGNFQAEIFHPPIG